MHSYGSAVVAEIQEDEQEAQDGAMEDEDGDEAMAADDGTAGMAGPVGASASAAPVPGAARRAGPVGGSGEAWNCTKCTLENEPSARRCAACDERRPRPAASVRGKLSLKRPKLA